MKFSSNENNTLCTLFVEDKYAMWQMNALYSLNVCHKLLYESCTHFRM